MQNGTVKKLVTERGFGFIQADDGKEYFFHRSGTEADFDGLRGGRVASCFCAGDRWLAPALKGRPTCLTPSARGISHMGIVLVIPGRRAAANPESSALFARVWIPGSACGSPGMTSTIFICDRPAEHREGRVVHDPAG